MPIRTALWKISPKPLQLPRTKLADERLLEDMIVAAPELLSEEWMLIGRQVDTGLGGRIDLLAIAPDASLVLVELKRDRTPRDVVAQALDYAGWVERLRPEEIAAIYERFSGGHRLAEDFKTRFGSELEEDSLNESHQIVIVAAALDDSSERIVNYLNDRDVPVNVLFFQVFAHGEEQFISRAWLLDPTHVQVNVVNPPGSGGPWNGEYYVSFGHDATRSWEDAVEFGFICAGGSPWYSRTLQLLSHGDRIWAKVPGYGFVGVGRVTGAVQRASDFTVSVASRDVPILDVAKRGHYHREHVTDSEKCEYFVPVRWLQTLPLAHAFQEIGLFGNQNTVCRPTTPKWRSTVDALKKRFPKHSD